MKTVALALAALAASASIATAHDTSRIDRAQSVQSSYIEQSRRSGQLTRSEYRELQAEQNRIAEMERRAKADGNVTGREYRAIREAQVDARRHIWSESHDRDVSIWRRWFSRYR